MIKTSTKKVLELAKELNSKEIVLEKSEPKGIVFHTLAYSDLNLNNSVVLLKGDNNKFYHAKVKTLYLNVFFDFKFE